jgi:hypothetical protein
MVDILSDRSWRLELDVAVDGIVLDRVDAELYAQGSWLGVVA